MSFATDLKYIMNNDPSINSYVNGKINYENLPIDYNKGENHIIYTFNKAANIQCLTGQLLYSQYNIIVKVISPDTFVLEKINDRLVEYLNGSSYGNIQDINFTNDSHSMDLDMKIYMNELQFDAIYLKNI